MKQFKFSVSTAAILIFTVLSFCDAEPTPKTSETKTRRDDSESESTDSDDGAAAAPTSVAPATVSFASFRMPPFSFAPSHPHFPPPPPLFAQIPAPPPPPMMMGGHPYHMMNAASSPFSAYYRPLPPPPPHPMMTARMSFHPMHPLASPFMPPPPPHHHHHSRSMLPVMVPIKRWDEHASLFDSLLSSDPGLENAFLDEPLVFDEEELLAARRHIPSPPPPPAHRRDSYDAYPSRQPHHRTHPFRDRDSYEPIPSENRFDGPSERISYNKHEREYDDRHDRNIPHLDRYPPPRNQVPVPGTPPSPSLDAYEEHVPRESSHAIERHDRPEPPPSSIDEYRRDP